MGKKGQKREKLSEKNEKKNVNHLGAKEKSSKDINICGAEIFYKMKLIQLKVVRKKKIERKEREKHTSTPVSCFKYAERAVDIHRSMMAFCAQQSVREQTTMEMSWKYSHRIQI
jgi:hypothetical protein